MLVFVCNSSSICPLCKRTHAHTQTRIAIKKNIGPGCTSSASVTQLDGEYSYGLELHNIVQISWSLCS